MRLEFLLARSDWRSYMTHANGGKEPFDKFVRYHEAEPEPLAEAPTRTSLEQIARMFGAPVEVRNGK